MINELKSRIKSWYTVQKTRRYTTVEIVTRIIPCKICEYGLGHLASLLNQRPGNIERNANHLSALLDQHKTSKTRIFIIAMPRTLHYLLICIRNIPKKILQERIDLVIVNNGLSTEEFNILSNETEIPVFNIQLHLRYPISHGHVLNILFKGSRSNFGIIDHDLYGTTEELWKALIHSEPDTMRGIFAITNSKLDWEFPRTHLMYFNRSQIERIMKQYHVSAEQYRNTPEHVKGFVQSTGLEEGEYLKPYLNYHDSLNLIMLMIRYENRQIEFVPHALEKSLIHVGGTSGRSCYDSNVVADYTDLRMLEIANSRALTVLYRRLYRGFDNSTAMRAGIAVQSSSHESLNRIDQIESAIG